MPVTIAKRNPKYFDMGHMKIGSTDIGFLLTNKQ